VKRAAWTPLPSARARAARLLAPALALVGAGLAPGAAHASTAIEHAPLLRTAPAARHDPDVSTNWAGYAVQPGADGTSFTKVSGRWVQPKATCTAGSESFSAFWVGLGGYSATSDALEQIGTEADCSAAGVASYAMWYEILPAPSVPIKFKVFPKNVITASVTVKGTAVSLQIRNLTRHTKFTKTIRVAAPDLTSAEWIAEAPTACNSRNVCRQLHLTNFGTVSFTGASATAAGHTGPIADPAWLVTPIELIESLMRGLPPAVGSTTTGAVPSEIASDGASFAVSWQTGLTPPASP
jgi:Peptidase A4 family